MDELGAAPGEERVRRCPHCGAICPSSATICFACKKAIPAVMVYRALRPGEMGRAEDAVARLTSEAGLPADRSGQPGRLRNGTKVLIAIVSLGVALVAVGEGAAVIGAFVGLIFVPFLIVRLVGDLTSLGPRGRETSEAAVRCFFGALRRERWTAAFACLSSFARENPVPRRTATAPSSPGGDTVFGGPKALRAYWRGLLGGSSFFEPFGRRVGKIALTRGSRAEAVHRFEVAFRLAYLDVRFDVVVLEYRSQWWLLTGEFGSPLDRDFPVESSPVSISP